jgi:GNAT superfamily N-acetyltransferase
LTYPHFTFRLFYFGASNGLLPYKEKEFFVIDEFTSVVDRTVAKVGSFAISKAIRRNKQKMIVLSCHYDIAEWLEPDWILDMRDLTFRRERLRRPEIELSINEIKRDAWTMFSQHHYLSANLSKTSQNYGCIYDNQLVGFAAVMPSMGHKDVRRVHRIVILPDFQGCGIGTAFLNCLGRIYKKKKLKLFITSSHPGIVRGLERNKNWRLSSFWKHGTRPHSGYAKNRTTRTMIPLASFEFVEK